MIRVEHTHEDELRNNVQIQRLEAPMTDKVLMDANFYITTSSEVEDSIPRACKMSLRGVYNEKEARNDAMETILKLMRHNDVEALPYPSLEVDDDLVPLITKCTNFTTKFKEYLQCLERSWTSHVCTTQEKIRRCLQKATVDMDDLERVKDRYYHKDPEFVSSQFTSRVSKLSHKLQQEMDTMRESMPGNLPNRQELDALGIEIQNSFADMARKVSSRRLQSVKEFFEYQMKTCETAACKKFQKHVEDWSKGLVMM
jgi:hypothetical protein